MIADYNKFAYDSTSYLWRNCQSGSDVNYTWWKENIHNWKTEKMTFVFQVGFWVFSKQRS